MGSREMSWRLVKRTLVVIAIVMAAAAGIGYWRLQAPFRIIRTLDARYQQVQRGMSTNHVEALMSYPSRRQTKYLMGFWDDAALPESESTRIRYSVRYSVATFFLPVTFEFTFDESGKVVGRHRYD